MQRIAAFLMSYLLVSPAFAAADTQVLEATEAAVEQTAHPTAHGAEHAAEHASGGLPQFDISTFPTQVFWLAIMFVIIYTLVKSVIVPQIGGTMDAREAHINSELEQAGILSEKARAAVGEYEAKMKTARLDAQAQLAAARDEIAKSFTAAEAAQREQFQSARDAAQAKINAQKDSALSAMESEAATLARSVTDKLTAGIAGNKKAAA